MRRPSCSRPFRPASMLLAGVLAGATLPAVAHAGPSDRSSARPVAVQVGLGPVVGLPGGGVYGQLPLDLQYHFRGGDVGPALGIQAPLHFSAGALGMHVGPIFIWDFRVTSLGRAKLYVGPLASTGYGFTAATHGGGAAHYWYLTLGVQFRALWRNRIGLFVRPASFDVLVGNGWAAGNWSLTAGLAAAF